MSLDFFGLEKHKQEGIRNDKKSEARKAKASMDNYAIFFFTMIPKRSFFVQNDPKLVQKVVNWE